LTPEAYAVVLDALGFAEQHVRMQVFGHHLASTAAIVEWTKGTALLRVRKAVDTASYEAFLAEYERRLIALLGNQRPYFYPFKRILFWAQR